MHMCMPYAAQIILSTEVASTAPNSIDEIQGKLFARLAFVKFGGQLDVQNGQSSRDDRFSDHGTMVRRARVRMRARRASK